MGNEDDASVQGNGTRQEPSNGSTSSPFLRTALACATNGARKPAVVPNGSSNGEKRPPSNHQRSALYFGHDREEVTRILIQALSDMGYQTAAESVSRESGYSLESPSVSAFRAAVLGGSWAEAEDLLAWASTPGPETEEGNGLVLAPNADLNVMKFWLRQQKYLELLEQREASRALAVLRSELTPLYHDTSKLHFLSSLLMCQSSDDLKAKADWDGAGGQSRRLLLSELSKCISPSVMLPENRLAVLLDQVKKAQIDACVYHTTASSPSLYSTHSCDRRFFPAEVALELTDVIDEVWQVQFSHDGTKLAACGSDSNVVVWDTTTFSILYRFREHLGGVCSVSWSPDDSMLVTCPRDRCPRLWDAQTGLLRKKLRRFDEPITGCVWTPDGQSFVVGTLDKQAGLCAFHVYRDEESCWGKKHRVQDVCGSPDGRWIVAVDNMRTIHVYNAMTRQLEYDMELKSRPTSISISQDSRHLLVNRMDGELSLIDLLTRSAVQKFLGHKGGDFVIRSSFGGANESFVISGSEDGNIVIWHKNSGAAVERLQGHLPRCNSVCWNPVDPSMIASCGDDGRVKIWTNKARCRELRSLHASASRESNGLLAARDRA